MSFPLLIMFPKKMCSEKSPLDKNVKILKWDVVNLTQKDDLKCCSLDVSGGCLAERKVCKEW